MPALFIKTSMLEKDRCSSSAPALTDSRSARSTICTWTLELPVDSIISDFRASSFSALRATSTTVAPLEAIARAVSAPRPPDAPVTTTTLPVRSRPATISFVVLSIVNTIRTSSALQTLSIPLFVLRRFNAINRERSRFSFRRQNHKKAHPFR